MTYLALFLKFFKYGFLAWGGPVAQISMIRDDLVDKEKWVSNDKFKKTLALYQILPGPEAHEMCVYMGMVKKGRWGGFLAGLGFMLPGFVLVIIASLIYQKLGSEVFTQLVCVKAVVAALVLRAAQRLSVNSIHNFTQILIAIAAIGLLCLGVNFFIVFLLAGLVHQLYKQFSYKTLVIGLGISLISYLFIGFSESIFHFSHQHFSWLKLFIDGLTAGSLSFGGAYTAIPILKQLTVGIYPHIDNNSFLDGVALSAIIPAPMIIFATYLGFMAYGFVGAILITVGTFFPAFVFTLIGHHHFEKITENKKAHHFLEGVTVGVSALLLMTAIGIAVASVNSYYAAIILAVALAAQYLFKSKCTIPALILAAFLIDFIMF